MEYVKSKFSGTAIYLGIIMLPCFFGFLRIIVLSILNFSTSVVGIFLSLFFFSLLLLAFTILKSIRYIIVKGDKLTYYSLLRPFGKTLCFDDYIGKITVQERGARGSYRVIYLIDKKNRTAFKIMGLHYKNFGKINGAIPLKIINFNPTIGEYYKLLYFERITIKESSVNTKTNKKLNKILIVIQIMSIIGLLLFIIGSTIKMLLKLG